MLPLSAWRKTFCTISPSGHLILAVRSAPIVGIDPLADNQVAHLLRERKQRDFLGILRLMIDAVRRTEKNGLYAEGAFDEALGQIQLPLEFGLGDLIELRMREGVIADFVAFGELTLENVGVLIGLLADDKEDGGRMFFLKDVENFRSPARIRAIVERENQLLLQRCRRSGRCRRTAGILRRFRR